MFKIETGVKLPERSKYPFSALKVGQSFLVEDAEQGSRAQRAAHAYGYYAGRKFVTKSTKEGLRIWRTA